MTGGLEHFGVLPFLSLVNDDDDDRTSTYVLGHREKKEEEEQFISLCRIHFSSICVLLYFPHSRIVTVPNKGWERREERAAKVI